MRFANLKILKSRVELQKSYTKKRKKKVDSFKQITLPIPKLMDCLRACVSFVVISIINTENGLRSLYISRIDLETEASEIICIDLSVYVQRDICICDVI